MLQVLRKALMLSLAAAMGVGVVAAVASAGSGNSPAITFASPSPSEGATLTSRSATFAFSYNRTTTQTRSLVCSLSGPSTSLSAPCDHLVNIKGGAQADKSYSNLANGSYTFTAKLTLTDGGTTSATRHFTAAVNQAPVATNDAYTTSEDTTLTVSAPVGVLHNDSDVDSPTLTAVLVTDPSHGTLTLNSDGSFTYTPTGDYNGPDSFTYKANDGSQDSNVATVSITITVPGCSVVNTRTPAISDNDLQDAITAASPGDELDITGRCVGNYVIGQNLTLKGIDTAGVKAKLDGNATGSVVAVVTGVAASITNLRITNGANDDNGGGIRTNGGTLTITDSTIDHNTAAFYGGGIYITHGSLTVTGSLIDQNSGGFGGGIGAEVATVSVTNSTVSGNHSTTSGGGIEGDTSATLTVVNTSLTGNGSKEGGGIGVGGVNTSLTLTDSTLTGNAAVTNGGGLLDATQSVVTASGNTITGNTPDNCYPANKIPGCV